MFTNKEINIIDVPHFDELSATKVFDMVRSNRKMQMYLPDMDVLKRPLNRQYLFNVRKYFAQLDI